MNRRLFRAALPGAWRLACGLMLLGLLAGPAAATLFEFRALSPQRVERLTKEARTEYELALAALDKVNYDLALEHLNKATQVEPDNPWLRFSAAQVAIYLGDTRRGADSIKFYDQAAQNLRSIADSPRLNVREQQRAAQWAATVTELRQSVVERDSRRVQHGREIAKQYAKEIYRSEESEKEKAAKDKAKKPGEKKPGEAGGEGSGEGLGPGETRDLRNSNAERETSPPPIGNNPDTARRPADSNTGERVDLQKP